MYNVELSRQSQKDLVNLKKAGLLTAARELVEIIKENPFQTPPPYEKLVGNLTGKYIRRINIKHRLVYSVLEEEKTIIILRMWSYYEFTMCWWLSASNMTFCSSAVCS